MSHAKKTRPDTFHESSWLLNRDPDFMAYEIYNLYVNG